jgi:hypothetical protein
MPQTIYCWRCKMDVPMLTEEEWQLVNPASLYDQIIRYRKETGCSLTEAYRKTDYPSLLLKIANSASGVHKGNNAVHRFC